MACSVVIWETNDFSALICPGKHTQMAQLNKNTEISNSNVALLVHSCDRYEFLYYGFDVFFSKYWDFDIACNYYFATEEKATAVNNFRTIQSGKGEWSDRL